MSKETVIIGCRLPNGLVLEVGYETVTESNGKMVPLVVRGPNYQRIVLKGWNAHSEAMRANEIQVPAAMDTRPYLNRNVDKAAWEEWKSKHPDSWLIERGILFEAKNEPDAQVKALDVAKEKLILAPLDKEALPPGIAVADFAKKKVG
jgi:hypothetical protein